MGTFTQLTAQDVQAILAQYDLGLAVSHEPLAAGTINTNVRVLTDRGAPVFLRINEGKSEPDVGYEAAVLAHLAARGVPTPAPHRTRAGAPFAEHKGKLVTLFPWAAGRHLGAREVLERHVAAVGAALARLHVAGADFPAAERRPGIYTLSHVQARFATFEQSGDPQLAQAVRLLGAELERLPRERVPDLPEGLLHQDLFRDNVLFGRAGATGSGGDEDAIVALLDFEQAAWGRLAYDLAVCLCAWCFQDQAFDPALVRAMVEAYERERPLLAAERAGLAVEARVAAVRFTVTRVTDVYMRPLGAPGGKDFRSYLARVRALGEAGLPVG